MLSFTLIVAVMFVIDVVKAVVFIIFAVVVGGGVAPVVCYCLLRTVADH